MHTMGVCMCLYRAMCVIYVGLMHGLLCRAVWVCMVLYMGVHRVLYIVFMHVLFSVLYQGLDKDLHRGLYKGFI